MQAIFRPACRVMLVVAPPLLSGPVAAQSSGVVVLRLSQAECLLEHAQAYIAQPGDPLLLFAGFMAA